MIPAFSWRIFTLKKQPSDLPAASKAMDGAAAMILPFSVGTDELEF
jgi:hypothetical protein